MTVGVIVEEPSAERFVKQIATKLRIRVKIRSSRGKGHLKRKLVAYANELSKDCQKILALVDSHCSDPLSVEQDFAHPSARVEIHVCVVVHAIESWLLGDSRAVARRLGISTLRTPSSPETLCNPEEALDRLFQLHGKRYLKEKDTERIAEFARPGIIARKCPSFERFRDSLRHC